MLEVIEKIVPGAAAAVEAFDDLPEAVLLGDEGQIVRRAVESRRREFATVRHCARRAMSQLGISPVAVLRDPKGAPVWPDGVVGSMTHCDGYRAAVLAPSADVASIGIDAEPNAPLPEGVLDLVASAGEQHSLRADATHLPDIAWDRLMFSAKESVYKAWYPLAKRWLGFLDVEIRFLHFGQFEAGLKVPSVQLEAGNLIGFRGQWHAGQGLLLTAVAELLLSTRDEA